MAILGTNVWYSKVVKSKKSWEIESIIELLLSREMRFY